eukprot:scaffold1698_cov394-Pavlova_lutheri.AAC.3
MLTFESTSHKVNRMDSGDDHADKDGETKDAKCIKVTLGAHETRQGVWGTPSLTGPCSTRYAYEEAKSHGSLKPDRGKTSMALPRAKKKVIQQKRMVTIKQQCSLAFRLKGPFSVSKSVQ